MAIELSASHHFSSSYQVVPGVLPRKLTDMETTEDQFKAEDLEGGLVRDHGGSVEGNGARYRSRGTEYSREPESSPPLASSPSADEFIDIKVSSMKA